MLLACLLTTLKSYNGDDPAQLWNLLLTWTSCGDGPWLSMLLGKAAKPACVTAQGDRDSTQLKLEDTVKQLAESRDVHERTVMEQQATSKTRDAVALEEKAKELIQLRASLEE